MKTIIPSFISSIRLREQWRLVFQQNSAADLQTASFDSLIHLVTSARRLDIENLQSWQVIHAEYLDLNLSGRHQALCLQEVSCFETDAEHNEFLRLLRNESNKVIIGSVAIDMDSCEVHYGLRVSDFRRLLGESEDSFYARILASR